jgi:hypothetical protein
LAVLQGAEQSSSYIVTSAAPRSRLTWSVVVAAAIVCVATAAIRYLSLTGFSNDHYQHLAGAQQMRFGEWPTRDFVDPGLPLMYAASAAAQWVFGPTLFAEAMLVVVAFGIAAAAVVIAAREVSGSLTVGIVASVLTLIAFPRPYAYPKLVFFGIAPLLIWAWMHRPTMARLVAIAAGVTVAFLFRHDHGVYLAIAALAGIALAPVADSRVRWRRVLTFAGLLLLMLAPYAIYVQIHGGLLSYIQDGIAFSQREADRTQLSLSAIAPGDEARLYYLFRALPLVALGWLVVDWRRRRWSHLDLMAAPLVVSALLVGASFLRDPLAARLPDVVVPVVLVGAWLAGRAFVDGSRVVRIAILAALALLGGGAGVSLAAVEKAGEQLHRTNLWLGINEVPRLFREKTNDLQARYARTQLPDGRLLPLVPFFEYLDRCTYPRHRLLMTGNAPEVYVYARRPFAAGHSSFIEGYFNSDREQARQVRRAESQVVAFVIEYSDLYPSWRRSFPELNAFVESRFRPFADIPVDDDRRVRVLVHSGLLASTVDRETGWPCYR